ncbi:MAG: hypothetical protein LBP34_01210 [Flavobacteriaceae bacterium]|jgi:cytochrome bd-type quinol oxidase subunit 2|nr:hypothetical protein [Flavobacteriaceae bacterium]
MNKKLDIDNLKKSWKEQECPKNQYSQAELVLMLNKKSRNNVKYIVIISIIEFIVLILSLFFTAADKNDMMQNLDAAAQEIYIRNYRISQILIYINIIASIGFVFYFYKCYKRIDLINSTKNLIENILNFRKSVNLFILINITLGAITLFLTGFYDFMSGLKEKINSAPQDFITIEKIHPIFSSSEYISVFIIICFFTILIIIAYYYLVYGTFLRKLKNNLKELHKFETDNNTEFVDIS